MKLLNSHIFLLSQIVDKMELTEDLPKIAQKRKESAAKASQEGYTADQKNADAEQLGFYLILTLGKKLHKAQKEVTQLLCELTGKKKEEVEQMAIQDTVKIVMDLISQEGVLDFLSDSVTE